MSKRPPNVLLIITDQHRADHLGAYGNTVVRTPNIDGLASRGTRFDRFYVSSPICMPNRSTLMTGRMPSQHGVRSNGIALTLDQHTFVDVLRAGGYATALCGKSHLQNMIDAPAFPTTQTSSPGAAIREARGERLEGAAYEQESPSRWRDPKHEVALPYYGFEHVDLATEHGDRVGGDYLRWVFANGGDPAKLTGKDNALPLDRPYRVPQAWRTRVPEELYPTTYVADKTIAWLEAHARNAGDQPFFMQCSFPDPHHPFTPPGKYWGMYDPDDMDAPKTCKRPDENAPHNLRWLHAERAAGRANVNTPGMFAIDAEEAREAIALTYGMITMIDDAVGRVLETLKRTGLHDDTIVIFTSDHGDFMGDHGLLLKGPLHYDGIVRTPFIWTDPRGPVHERVIGKLAGTIDISSTVLDVAGLAPYAGMQGRSLVPLLAGESPSWRSAMLIEEDGQRPAFGLKEAPRLRTVVTEDARLSMYAGVERGEIYDLENDPLETADRWDDVPRRGQLLEELHREMLAMWDRSPEPTRLA